MTTTVKIRTAGHPVKVTKIHKHPGGDTRSEESKIPPNQEVEIVMHNTLSVAIDELPYEAPATDR